MIFDKFIELLKNLELGNTLNKLRNFEKMANDYILSQINNNDNIK